LSERVAIKFNFIKIIPFLQYNLINTEVFFTGFRSQCKINAGRISAGRREAIPQPDITGLHGEIGPEWKDYPDA